MGQGRVENCPFWRTVRPYDGLWSDQFWIVKHASADADRHSCRFDCCAEKLGAAFWAEPSAYRISAVCNHFYVRDIAFKTDGLLRKQYVHSCRTARDALAIMAPAHPRANGVCVDDEADIPAQAMARYRHPLPLPPCHECQPLKQHNILLIFEERAVQGGDRFGRIAVLQHVERHVFGEEQFEPVEQFTG